EKDEDGYEMLDEDTKKLFNNSLSSYSDNIKYIRLVINKFIKEKTVTDLNIIGKKYSDNNGFKGEVIDCEIISTIWSYIEISDLYYYKNYNWFKNLKLKEYSLKKYKISFDEIEKEDEKWEANFK
ncbi:MAG: hypothetical protein RSF67_02240, partial [Clostridia bacterium]